MSRPRFFYNLSKNKSFLLMLAPAVIHIFIFAYLPMGGIVLAFKQFNYQDGIFGSPWVGLENFRFFFLSGDAFKVTRNTVLYNLAFLTVNTSLQLIFAVILSEVHSKYFKKTTQSIIFLPHFVSWVIVASIAYNLFNYETGLLNKFLTSLGIEPINIYMKPSYWKYILIGFNAWKGVGYGTVVYLAAIVAIDSQLYESAEIDGANIFQRTWYITFPCLVPTIIVLVLLAIGQIFRGDFGLFYQLIGNNGMLFDATDIIDTYVFRSLMQSSEIGMAAAAGFYQSLMCFVMIMVTNFAVKKVRSDYALF